MQEDKMKPSLLSNPMPHSTYDIKMDQETLNGTTHPSSLGSPLSTLKHWVIGKPRDPMDPNVFHKISLMAFFAWVGLGADGLSSSCYGPDEAFRALSGHEYLAIHLALMTALTVGIISFSYSLLIEHFPTGGGGYVVATKLLGPKAGVVSGSALVIDYVLTITISIASGIDAIFSFLPVTWLVYKVPTDLAALALLIILNLRGVKESIEVLLPIFLLFVATHLLLIGYGIIAHSSGIPEVLSMSHTSLSADVKSIGAFPLLFIFLRAFSLGGGTYTGIEAVSNGLPILREPRVATGKRTMLYMASSLAFTAGGILLCYLLWHASPEPGKTMNAVLLQNVFSSWTIGQWHVGAWLIVFTLISEGALLLVAAQTGFIDGPRVLSNMALDNWMPHRFTNLSERLVTKYGILIMGFFATILLIVSKGQVSFLVVLYSINVFLTFSLTEMGMSRFWATEGRAHHKHWFRNLLLQLTGLTLCLTILFITTIEKFSEGGWLTLAVTSVTVGMCFLIKKHYLEVTEQIRKLDTILKELPGNGKQKEVSIIDPSQPVAALLVSGYGGLGIHSLLSIHRLFPGLYKNMLFLSIGAVDSGHFKGVSEVENLKKDTEENLKRYVACAQEMGLKANYRYCVGTEVLTEAEALCREVAAEFPRVTFYLGNLIFKKENLYYHLLHNHTAYALERRLQFDGIPTVVLPIRMHM